MGRRWRVFVFLGKRTSQVAGRAARPRPRRRRADLRQRRAPAPPPGAPPIVNLDFESRLYARDESISKWRVCG
ncbi:hypothetical protein EVAR_15706_1 [Eumeta japonica]|uniref:Uncharacterized protein n=1 Tax=Eumeta variegata TaxID=151549 RepID=A0A4C1U9H1_EUMVA|nr:hypothetical protein EVAR_15706_1 [Eumeta japonica]